MATTTLRPLSIGEILDAGIKVFARHWRVLILCVVGLVLPVQIIQVLLVASVDAEQLQLDPENASEPDIGPAAVGYGLSLIISGLVFLFAFTACFKAVSDAWLGTPPTVGRSLAFGLRRLPIVVVTWIVWIVPIVLGIIPLFTVAVWLGVAWSVALPALLFENIGPFRALARSYSLIKGRWWATCALVIVGYLVVGWLGSLLAGLLYGLTGVSSGDSEIANSVALVIGGTLSSAIVTPYRAAVLTILYFDQRVRKEGFDLQLMAENLGVERDPDAPLPAPLIGPEITPEQRAAAPYWPPPPGWTPPPPETTGGWAPPRADEGEASLWAPPDEVSPDPLADDESAPPPAEDRGEPDAPPRDRGRAGWLPPEAPRGPSGL